MKNFDSFPQELYDVVDFQLIGPYTLLIRFDDNTEQVIDFTPILLGPLFGPLQDRMLFESVKLDHELGTLVWPNGADIDPTVLHDWPAHVDAIVKRRREKYGVALRTMA